MNDSLHHQAITAAALTDHLFGAPIQRKQTDIEKLDEAIILARKVSDICGELKHTLPESFDAAMQENKDLLHSVLNNFAAVRMHFYMVANAAQEPCDCNGKCDDCVAARSDEHYDRKRDGGLEK